jgi:GTP cyclohydrolase I
MPTDEHSWYEGGGTIPPAREDDDLIPAKFKQYDNGGYLPPGRVVGRMTPTDAAKANAYMRARYGSLNDKAGFVLQEAAGLDVTTPHGLRTPARFVSMLQELTSPVEFEFTTFPSDTDEMVVVADIPFVSLCEHHVVPFIGVAHVAYVPGDLLAGLSKFARTVKFYAAALQQQERLTNQVADRIEKELDPRGVGVIIKAEHLCMTIRGVQAPGAKTTTAAMRGVFGDHERTAKQEFLAAISG